MNLKRTMFVMLAVLVWSGCFGKPEEETATIEAPAGTFVGLVQDGSAAFKGIPYAAPVDGARRFRPAQAAAALSEEFSAQEFGPPCAHLNQLSPEKRKPEDFVDGPACLNLNVWAPMKHVAARGDPAQAPLPVMVFIHGGAFDIGFSGWKPRVYLYDGARLAAAGDVVVVSINYRLGALGFLHHEALGKDSGGAANLGIRDQLLALRWVRHNISAFGGDANNVTIFGESAGAISICDLMLLPEARGLFHKAIMQSGSCMLRQPEQASQTTEAFLTNLGCFEGKTPEQQAACVQEKDNREIVLAQPKMARLVPTAYISLPFGPVLDGITFSDIPDEVIGAGRHIQLPVLIGTTAKEVPAWMEPDSKDQWESVLKEVAGDSVLASKIREYYEARSRGNYQTLLADLKTDLNFTCRARSMAHLIASHQKEPVHLYLFEKGLDFIEGLFGMAGIPAHGSFHGMELIYLFRHIPQTSLRLPLLASHQDLQAEMTALWAGFARSGRIADADLAAEWLPYQEARIAGIIGDFTGVLDDPRGDVCELLGPRLMRGGPLGTLK